MLIESMNVKQRLGRQFDFRVWNTSVGLTDVSIPEPCEKGDESVASDGRERRVVWQEGCELGELNAVVFDGVGAFTGCFLEKSTPSKACDKTRFWRRLLTSLCS